MAQSPHSEDQGDCLRHRATHASHRARAGLGHSVGIAIVALCLAGCDDPNSNGALRVRLFERCMQMLPAGPRSTHYNDWDEVVDACDSAARFQARMCGRDAQSCMSAAQGIETRRAETPSGSVHESPVPQGMRPNSTSQGTK